MVASSRASRPASTPGQPCEGVGLSSATGGGRGATALRGVRAPRGSLLATRPGQVRTYSSPRFRRGMATTGMSLCPTM